MTEISENKGESTEDTSLEPAESGFSRLSPDQHEGLAQLRSGYNDRGQALQSDSQPEQPVEHGKRNSLSRRGFVFGAAALALTPAAAALSRIFSSPQKISAQEVGDVDFAKVFSATEWKEVPGKPGWTMAESESGVKVALITPADRSETKSSFPYRTNKSLMENNGRLNLNEFGNGDVEVIMEFKGNPVNEEAKYPHSRMGDYGLIIDNGEKEESEDYRAILVFVEGSKLYSGVHNKYNTETKPLWNQKQIAEISDGDDIKVGIRIPRSGTSVNLIGPDGKFLPEKLELPPGTGFFNPNNPRVGAGSFVRKGFNELTSNLMVLIGRKN